MYALSAHELHTKIPQPDSLFHFDAPWILLKHIQQQVNYEFTTLDSGIDEHDTDCIALSFISTFSMKVGSELKIGVPLPDSLRDYNTEIVACMNTAGGFEITLLITIDSDMDLLTLMRSNAYLGSGYNA
ncbi:MAG: hypothetical protein MI673_06610 [Thiotrichales bacterium]|nr:hypothetical protein [Thiotrichales bacterium]